MHGFPFLCAQYNGKYLCVPSLISGGGRASYLLFLSHLFILCLLASHMDLPLSFKKFMKCACAFSVMEGRGILSMENMEVRGHLPCLHGSQG